MTSYALDSDTVSFILKEQVNVCSKFNTAIALDDALYVPPYVYYEVQRWLTLKNAMAKQKIFDSLYEETGISPISRAELDRAISLYVFLTRQGIVISDSDILIAAFCIENGYTLVTNNVDHYRNIPGLVFENWNI
jgi:predicted nucleic acid-binding protein